MKRTFALILALVMVFAMTACTQKQETQSPDTKTQSENVAQSDTATTGGEEETEEKEPLGDLTGDLNDGLDPYLYNTNIYDYLDDSKTYKIAFCSRNNAGVAFWTSICEAVKRSIRDCDTYIEYDAQNKGDVQLNQLEDCINSGVDIIILACADPTAVLPGVEHANELGIPVICIDSSLEESNRDLLATTLATDSYGAGQMIGEHIVQDMGEDFKIMVYYNPTGVETMKRFTGANDVFAQYPGIEVIPVEGAGVLDTALEKCESALQADPDIDVFYGANDNSMLGGTQAMESMGILDKVKVYNLDCTDVVFEYLQKGIVSGCAAQQVRLQGKWAVQACYRILLGMEVDHELPVPVIWVDQSNYNDYIDPGFCAY